MPEVKNKKNINPAAQQEMPGGASEAERLEMPEGAPSAAGIKPPEVAEAAAQPSSQSSKLAEYENDLKRLQAEFENYKKRVEREKKDWIMQGKAEAIREFLVLSDELDAAASHAKNSTPAQLAKGIELLHAKCASMLKSAKISEIDCSGFADHALHDVLMAQEGGEEGKISAVIKKGFKIGDTIIRHAQVAVYSGEKKAAEEKEEAESKNATEGKNGKEIKNEK